jgi:glycosyltransferase involved in cell wall biosynthesis
MSHDASLISIIMPAYNAGRFIAASIDSVLAQTYPHWELIIVDDGSTDDTVEIACQAQDPRIRLFALEHSGYSSKVRNFGLAQARGDFIAFLDADDLYEPDALASLLTHLLENPSCIAVHGFERFINEHGEPIPSPWAKHRLPPLFPEDDAFRLSPAYAHSFEKFLFEEQDFCQLQALMLRRTTLQRVGPFEEKLYHSQDKHYYLRLYQAGLKNFHFIARPVFQYRVYPASITKDNRRLRQLLDGVEDLVNVYYRLLAEELGFPFTKAALAAKEYRWILSVRLRTGDFGALLPIILHAARNRQLSRVHLIYCILIELAYRYTPNLVARLKKPKTGSSAIYRPSPASGSLPPSSSPQSPQPSLESPESTEAEGESSPSPTRSSTDREKVSA